MLIDLGAQNDARWGPIGVKNPYCFLYGSVLLIMSAKMAHSDAKGEQNARKRDHVGANIVDLGTKMSLK